MHRVVGVELAGHLDSPATVAAKAGVWNPDELLPSFIASAAAAMGDLSLVARVTDAYNRGFVSQMATTGAALFEARPDLSLMDVQEGGEKGLAAVGPVRA